ncbi:glycosyltransferase family 2 protein [Mongoliitalea lutea]|uniref:Glycosyltransferase, catalytic subunit of cellulose synthase and poly-beta-1,6-N-acetylglucosamine synthase n=1 Tax=Mongoliitalea lutea TaxID=849756 RepID=A0A8J3D101_9BACT|nr:glycosyltransferase family 2 protein [Mongoliitalea lutea]GHB49793.1 hypothetical protein GCM10008106_33260 [Mongoliitalea lutea]
MEVLFNLSLVIIVYTFFGYALILMFLVVISGKNSIKYELADLPLISLIVPCFNEGKALKDKIENTLALDYPSDKLQLIFVCDGSNDGSEKIPQQFEQILTLYNPERKGKLAAMKRAVTFANGEILVFCDGNTVLNPEALKEIVQPYVDKRVGAVTGEKYILTDPNDTASSKGEGFYWKYESFLKQYDSYYNTLVGGAGELMSYRKELFEELPDNTILDDFMLTMSIAQKGFKVKYTPNARASEFASSNVEEELKRKIRIAAGGWQSVMRLKKAINPFHDFKLFFQYVSHRVLRWTLTPFLLVFVFIFNHFLIDVHYFYYVLLILQYVFYFLAFTGYLLRNKVVKIPGFFTPYYFVVMNYAAIAGFFRWLKNDQKVTWERAKRANE